VDLRRALRVGPKARLALVGAGGKTTTLFELGQALVASGQAQMALLTTTTHLGAWQVQDADHHMALENSAQVDALGADLPAGVMVCTGAVEAGDDVDRLPGLAPQVLDALRRLADERGLPLLVEADGARMRPLKAPAAHEPVIPPWVEQVVVVAGLSGLGQPL